MKFFLVIIVMILISYEIFLKIQILDLLRLTYA